MKVKEKVVVVTGGGSGIGQQVVLNLLKKGATVAAVDINGDALNDTKKLAGSLADKLSLHLTDIANRESVTRLAKDVISQHGCVDAIINNAGIIHPFKSVNELDYSVVERMINVNFYGTVNVTKEFLPLLLERPIAHITNVSSMGGLFAFPKQTLYGASKAAVKLFSEGLYAELRGSNIGVTVVFPGAINTNITKNCDAHNERLEELHQKHKGTSPETAAMHIVDGMEKNKFRVLIGVDARIFSFLYRILPRLTIVLIGRMMKFAMPD